MEKLRDSRKGEPFHILISYKDAICSGGGVNSLKKNTSD